jgi:hypothetical protein
LNADRAPQLKAIVMLLHLTQNILRLAAVALLVGVAHFASAQERFTPPAANPDEWDCAVRGRVVDGSNKPIAHAMVVLNDVHQVFFSESDADGNFVRESHCWRSPIKRILFVTSPFVLGGIAPIAPPDFQFSELGSAFSGQPIVLKKNEVLNVGDVHAQVYYSQVVVTFRNSTGQPLFRNDIDWRLVWLRVRNNSHRIVAETSMSINKLETHVRKSDNVIPMHLPEGEWFLEISPYEDKGPWYKSAAPVVVRRSNSPMEITLRMAK